MTEFTKFPSIESFGHVWRFMNRKMDPKPVMYGAKIKLHGTNAGVRISSDGSVVAQSRSRDITPDDDNAGFARWVAETERFWRIDPAVMQKGDEPIKKVIFYGEWAGSGIQKNDAVTKLNGKYFFVFAVQIDDMVYTDDLEGLIPDLDNVLVLPWHGSWETIDFVDQARTNVLIEAINKEVEAIGECDPFIKDVFGIEGPGEGLVYMPVSDWLNGMERDTFAALTFKAKAEAHRVKNTEKAVSARVAIPAGVGDFVATFVTEARLMQGLTEACDGIAEKPRTADFLSWMGNDIKKESAVELEEMGLSWKDVAGHVNKAAVRWFIAKCESPMGEAA